MKNKITFLMLSLVFSLNVHAQSRAVYEQQQKRIYDVMTRILPSTTVSIDGFTDVYVGQTENGKRCLLSGNKAAVFAIDSHPDMSAAESNYSTYMFNWDPNRLDMRVGFGSIHPYFKESNGLLEASVKVPEDYGSAKYGIRIESLGNGQTAVSIQNRKTLIFDKYLTCIFKR